MIGGQWEKASAFSEAGISDAGPQSRKAEAESFGCWGQVGRKGKRGEDVNPALAPTSEAIQVTYQSGTRPRLV